MRYPRFIAETALPANRRKLWFSIASGYAIVGLFAGLAALAQASGAIAFDSRFYVLIALKLASNTLALWGLRADRFVLETSGLNLIADVLAMTGAVYLTGGIVSPLLAIYAIEITVVALLTNLGVTVLTAAGMILLYAAMAIATHVGALPWIALPPAWPPATPKLAAGLLNAALVLAVPTFFCALILRLLRERERALEVRTTELIEAGRQKGQFMVNVTHELRTPIHGICGLSELVESGVYGPVTQRQLDAQADIQRSARALLRMIDDLLMLARSDAGRLALDLDDVELHELLASLVGVIRRMVGTKSLEVAAEIDPDVPVVRTDRAKLNQAILNLLTNAVKFTPEGGRVTVGARRDGPDCVAIEVQDTGVGIPVDAREKIFEDFWQADGSPERRYGGAGVGLAVVKRLVDLLGATVTVDSAEGQGSTFKITLPVRR